MVTLNDRVGAIDTKAIGAQTERTLARIESTLKAVDAKRLSDEGAALLAELRDSNAELKRTLSNPALQKIPEETHAAVMEMRKLVADPRLAASIVRLERTLARLDRLTGGSEGNLASTLENLRDISADLRELTENAKRHPSNLLFGEPPTPLERNR
jgi:hypothetical protein